MKRFFALPIVCLCLLASSLQAGPTDSVSSKAASSPRQVVRLELEDKQPGTPVRYALERLTDVLKKRGVRLDPKALPETPKVLMVGTYAKSDRLHRWIDQNIIQLPKQQEALAVKHLRYNNRSLLTVVGYDDAGLMYALLDLADYVEHLPDNRVANWFNSTADVSEAPRNKMRRMRVLLHHEANERQWYHSKAYWDWYLGMLATNRFNELNLVYSHQTPYMAPMYAWHVKVDEFPDVRPAGTSEEERQKNLDALRYIAKRCKELDIDLTIGIWQQVAWKASLMETPHQQDSQVEGLDEKNLERYVHLAVKKLLKECPGISRLQLRLNFESGIPYSRQAEFFNNGVIRPIQEVAPHVGLDLRTVGARSKILKVARESGLDLRTSFKFYGEFMGQPHPPREACPCSYSYKNTQKPFANPQFNEIWMLGSHRLLLWGSEDYGRRFGRVASFGGTIGFETDGPLAQKGFRQGSLPAWRIFRDAKDEYYHHEIERYWAFFRTIGRFSYNPETSRAVWMRPFHKRFGAAAEPMAQAYEAASRVIGLIVAGHTENANMYTWPEINMGSVGPAHYDLRGVDQAVFPSINTQVDNELAGRMTGHLGALRLADQFDSIANRIDQALARADTQTKNPSREYRTTGNDFRILADLARYHACRQREGYHMAKFYRTGDGSLLDDALREAEASLAHWKNLTKIADRQYHDHLVLGPEEQGHWKDKLPLIEGNIKLIREAQQVLREYGLFEKGFDFGSPAPDQKYRTFNFATYGNDHLRQRRFLPVHPGIEYDPHAGYGFTQDKGLKSTSREKITKKTLNGVQNESDLASIPLDMLAADFVHADREFRFRIDMPLDEYRFTFLFADRSPEPRDHGPLNIRTEQRSTVTNRVKDVRVPAGKSVVRQYDYQIQSSWYPFIIFGFQPTEEKADAMLSALTLHRNIPVLAHASRRHILPHTPCTLSATITMPPRPVGKDGQLSAAPGDRLAEAVLHFRTDRQKTFQTLPLQTDDGLTYHATLQPHQLRGIWLEYYFTARDTSARATRLPEQAPVQFYRSRISADTNAPTIVHRPITRWTAGQPMPIEAHVTDPDGVAVVRVHYRTMDQRKPYDSLLMERRGNKYVATIPGSAIRSDYDFVYYLEAVDETATGSFFPDWRKANACIFVTTSVGQGSP